MAYIITKTDGSTLLTIDSSTQKNTQNTSLTIFGKGTLDYGQDYWNNQIKMLENFAYGSEPLHSIMGQLWYDTSVKKLKVHNGTS